MWSRGRTALTPPRSLRALRSTPRSQLGRVRGGMSARPPPGGPDVTGGNVTSGTGGGATLGGHAHKNPPRLCYESLSDDPACAAGTVKTFKRCDLLLLGIRVAPARRDGIDGPMTSPCRCSPRETKGEEHERCGLGHDVGHSACWSSVACVAPSVAPNVVRAVGCKVPVREGTESREVRIRRLRDEPSINAAG